MTVEATWIDGGGMRTGVVYTDCEDLRRGISAGKVAAGDEVMYRGFLCAVLDILAPELLVLRSGMPFIEIRQS